VSAQPASPPIATGEYPEMGEQFELTEPGMDWSEFGVVLPVLSGSSGAGASVFAAAAVDALQRAGRCALLVDGAEPSRSGLSAAAAVEGAHSTNPAPAVRVRYSWRSHAVLARMETYLPALTPIPPLEPRQWLPVDPPLAPLHVTVVDVGQEWARATTNPLSGACGWLRAGAANTPEPCPMLIVRATRPSLMAAEAALARLDPWISSGEVVAPVQLVVMASWKRRGWPSGVTGTAGARVARLLEDAVFVPYDRDLDLGGINEEPTPPRVQSAVASVLDQWDLLTPTPPDTWST
jgi:hypothetical protein